MKRNRGFCVFYVMLLTVFTGAVAALAVQFREIRQGDEFYEQAAEAVFMEKGTGYSRWLSKLSGVYPGMIGWLQIPDTSVNYPVMSGPDNQFYLNHLPDGSENVCGSLFLDCRSNQESLHFIIYGHNGADGKMFGILKQYESADFFEEHPAFTVITPEFCHVCPVFSVRRVKADGDDYRMDFRDKEELLDYANHAAAESLYDTDTDFGNMAGIVTLSTCTGRRNQRLIVQGVLPRE